jgi:starvation-inducible DNA-binding protein
MAVQTRNKTTTRDIKHIVGDLTRENRPASPIVTALNRQVSNGFVLYANFKQYHWQTYGPLFRDLHKLFDTFAEEVRETIDELAERIRMIGQDPPGLTEMIDTATVSIAAPHSTMREMVEEARNNALIVIDEFRRAARAAEEHDDPGTVDICSRFVQIHEKQEWWLRDILRQGDGLTGEKQSAIGDR